MKHSHWLMSSLVWGEVVFLALVVLNLSRGGGVMVQAQQIQVSGTSGALHLSEAGVRGEAESNDALAVAMGRRIILENWTAYREAQGIRVVGQVRNTSRSSLRSPLYAIADFYTAENEYLSSRESLVSPSPLPLDQSGEFAIFLEQPEDRPKARRVELSLRVVLADNQGEINFRPTTSHPLSLSVKDGLGQGCQGRD
jgi:hypothetical protein